ncbi:hypothetical protein F8S13_25130 [Chloroflexia bacterium SDU3-3]|nr:hypothetical protein F8S13_25130 [Chloroflexia bacterium SDU3-3]
MTVDFAAREHVQKLRRAGLRPSEALIHTITRSGAAAFAPLLELATNFELFDGEEPEIFAPIHALRLLGELPQLAMIEPLLRKYPVATYGEWDELPRLWATETPQIIGRLGAAAHPALWAIVDSAEWEPTARTMATIALSNTTAVAPELRQPLIEAYRERMRGSEDMVVRTNAVVGLTGLGSSEDYQEIMALYRGSTVNKGVVAASTARQLLLGGGEKTIACTTHTLAERYEQHGPNESAE